MQGVLVDHLVPGSKESWIAADAAALPLGEHVLVVGHPYVDIWQVVRPERVGVATGPQVPRRSRRRACARTGWPGRRPGRPGAGPASHPRPG
ncbi:MAG: DUF3097 family protein [Nocardioides sp.]